jgi:hypothetical protein
MIIIIYPVGEASALCGRSCIVDVSGEYLLQSSGLEPIKKEFELQRHRFHQNTRGKKEAGARLGPIKALSLSLQNLYLHPTKRTNAVMHQSPYRDLRGSRTQSSEARRQYASWLRSPSVGASVIPVPE